MKIIKTTFKTLAALAFALIPTIALAHPNRAASAHMRPNLSHTRTVPMHERGESAHHT